MYRKASYIAARLVGLLVVLLLAAAFAVQLPSVQTTLSHKILDRLTSNADAAVSYDQVRVTPSGLIHIKGLCLVDRAPYTADEFGRGWDRVDTVFTARSITASLSIKGLFAKKGVHVGRVNIEDGMFHLAIEPFEDRNLANIARIFGGGAPKEKKPLPEKEVFSVDKISLHNFRFRMNSFVRMKQQRKEGAIYYDDLDVTLDLKGHDIGLSGGKVRGTADKLSFVEKSGYRLNFLSGSCTVRQGFTIVEDIHLVDEWSDVKAAYYSMSYDGAEAFRDYVSGVLMGGKVSKGTRLSTKTLFYFTGGLRDIDSELAVESGDFLGYVNDFEVSGLKFRETASDISAKDLRLRLTGLPDFRQSMLSAEGKELRFTKAGLESILRSFSPRGKAIRLPENISGKQHYRLDFTASGHVSRLSLSAHLASEAGSLRASGSVRNLLSRRRATEISGKVETFSLNVKEILKGSPVGRCSVYASASASLDSGLSALAVDSLRIDRLEFGGYGYNSITATAQFSEEQLNAAVRSSDPNLKFAIEASSRLGSGRRPRNASVSGKVENLDLHALNLYRRWNTARTNFDIDFSIAMLDSLADGHIFLGGLQFENSDGLKDIGDIAARLSRTGKERSFHFESAFADLDFRSDSDVRHFMNDLQAVSTRRELPSLYTTEERPAKNGEYSLSLLMKDSRDLFAFVLPGLYIANGTTAKLDISNSGELFGKLESQRLAFGTTYLLNTSLLLDNGGEALSANIEGEEFKTGNFSVDAPTLSLSAEKDDLSAVLHFNAFSSAGGEGEIAAEGTIYRDSTGVPVFRCHPLESFVNAGGSTWKIDESDLVLRGKDIYVKGFRIHNRNQSLSIDGGYAKSSQDTLRLALSNVDIEQVENFLPKRYGLKGVMDGTMQLNTMAGHAPEMLMDFRADSLSIGGTDAGSLRIATILEDEGEDIGIYLRHEIAGRTTFYAHGFYFLNDGRTDVSGDFDRFPLAPAAPFLDKVFSEMDGSISGTLKINGQGGHFNAESKGLSLNDARVKLAYTGASYTMSGPLRMDNSGLYFDGVQIRDDAAGTGLLSGAMRYEGGLDNLSLDARLDFSRLKLVDAPQRSSGFYGLLTAGGNASLQGPLNALTVNADVSTEGDGEIHIPLGGKMGASGGNLLTFTEKEKEIDPYEQMLGTGIVKKKGSSDMDIHARLNVHSGVKAFVEMDTSVGNMASFSGNGGVTMHLRPSKAVFDLTGDFNIREGDYQFIIPGIITKAFSIQEGSSIKFGGDILNTELDINAIYKLRTSLSAIVTDAQTAGARRLVECGISISDRLRNPNISFSVNVPDLNPTVKSQIDLALRTSDKVQKQFMALLLMGSFVPDENSGVVNGSEILFSNMTELMSNQLNTILQKLDIPLDIGIGYQGTSQGTNMFDVAISTQLFNNRVIVGGTVANRRFNNTVSSGDVVGDLDIQIKLDEDGQFRLNIFSHSADEYTSYLDLSQRNGVGLSFQKEFSSFTDMWNRFLRGKKTPAGEAGRQSGVTTIKIEADERQR